MRIFKPLFSGCVLSLLTFSHNAKALDYPSALNNHHLKEELEEQNDRLIPKFDWFSASVDGQVYFRNLEEYDFYHGAGYWIQARTEFRPSEIFTLNVRSIFYSGSISGGYTNPTGQYNLFGFSLKWPEPVLGGTVDARIIDIERQTIGEGLFIEEREMAGGWLRWSNEKFSLKVLKEGTGGLVYGDDLNNVDLKLANGLLGAGTIFWDASKQSEMPKNRMPLYYLYSAHSLGPYVSYFAEAGLRNKKYAGLLGFKSEGASGRLKYKTRLQTRFYDDGFAEEFVQQIDNMYISYDQYNKRYTSPGNIFVLDDNVYVYSAIVDLDYELNHKWVLQSKNEVARFDYNTFTEKNFYFYRVGVTHYILEDREESITAFASNKVLSDSFARPPSDSSLEKIQPLFRRRNFYGVEATFRF